MRFSEREVVRSGSVTALTCAQTARLGSSDQGASFPQLRENWDSSTLLGFPKCLACLICTLDLNGIFRPSLSLRLGTTCWMGLIITDHDGLEPSFRQTPNPQPTRHN